MGYNTGILILNDSEHTIRENPESFVKNMTRAMGEMALNPNSPPHDFAIGNHGNGGTVFHLAHADMTGVYAIGGNHTSRLTMDFNGGRHYSIEEKVKLLKKMASELGYRVSKKPNK